MKKTILFTFFIFLLNINLYSNKKEETKIESKYTTYKVIDSETKEELAGAYLNINNVKYYTDFNGELNLEENNKKVTIYLISYQIKEVVLNNNKKVIELKRL